MLSPSLLYLAENYDLPPNMGWRSWAVRAGKLHSPQQRTKWTSPVLNAQCTRYGNDFNKCFNDPKHLCGVHSAKDPNMAVGQAWKSRWAYKGGNCVLGAVRHHGTTLEGDKGYRSANATIDTLWAPDEETAQQLEKNYPGVQVLREQHPATSGFLAFKRLTPNSPIQDNLTKSMSYLRGILAMGDKYIKHSGMWCPISRTHRDPVAQAEHNAAAKRENVEEDKPAPTKSYRSEAADKRHADAKEWRKTAHRKQPKQYNNKHEADVDTKIAETHEAFMDATRDVYRAADSVHYAVRDKQDKHGNWTLSTDQAIDKLKDVKVIAGYGADPEKGRKKLTDDLANARKTAREARDTWQEEEKKYGGWSRFFLVQNKNGHIHSGMHCPTCKLDTRYAWLTDVSGLEEKDAVDKHGPLLCSHCFPTAPAEWTEGHKKDMTGMCPGSGKYHEGKWNDRYGKCPECERHVSITRSNSGGKYRTHAPLTEDEKKVRDGMDKSMAEDLTFKLKLGWRNGDQSIHAWEDKPINGKTAKVRVHETAGKKKLYAVDITEDGKTRTVSTKDAARELGVR